MAGLSPKGRGAPNRAPIPPLTEARQALQQGAPDLLRSPLNSSICSRTQRSRLGLLGVSHDAAWGKRLQMATP
jgi:hypothetical protein